MLTYFTNALNSGMNPQPNEKYRELQQAVIDDQWDNTSAIEKVLEQESIGSSVYNEIDVWVNYVVGQSSTGEKTGADFLQFGFKDINHPRVRGRYYKFDDNIWMIYDYNYHNGLARNVAVRRCNNALRWINPNNGAVEAVPCIIDYDMSSPSIQVNQSILTPNNHAVIKIQGNDLTNSQLKTNMRFILGGRPFKLYGLQNAMLESQSNPNPTYLVYDLYLDEEQSTDDVPNAIAFNGHYNYTIVPNQLSIEATPSSMGNLTAKVLLNGANVTRPIIWESSNSEIIQIDNNGQFNIVGAVGDTAVISVWLEGNELTKVEIPVAVVDIIDDTLSVRLLPTIEKIRQHETIDFEVLASKYGESYTNFTSKIFLSDTQEVSSNKFLSIKSKGTSAYKLSCTAFDSTLKTLYVTVVDNDNNNIFKESFELRTISMFG